MNKEILKSISDASIGKISLLKRSKSGYIVSSAFAGCFIGIGVLISFTVGGLASAANNPLTKVYVGLAFSIALTLVIFTSTELFTGNNYVLLIGRLDRKASTKDLVSIWIFSWIGNLIGAIILSLIFVYSGLIKVESTRNFFLKMAVAKASMPAMEMFCRAILCNFLVCLAVMISCFKMKNEAAKVFIVIMCLFAFVTSGFEHSIANMTVFSIALFIPSLGVNIGQIISSLLIATLGNIVGGGIILGCGTYYWMSK